MGLVLIQNEDSGFGVLGGISSSFGAPVAQLSVNGGGQIQTVNGFNEQGQAAPVYAYVVEGVPQVQLNFERGCPFVFEGGEITAKFAVIGGTATVSAGVDNAVADPTGSFSTGTGGASFSFISQSIS